MGRLLNTGEYQLAGVEVKLIPNGIIARRLEGAESTKEKALSKMTKISDKLRDERRVGKLQDRARRKEVADLTEEVLTTRKLCMDLGKKVVHTERKADSCIQTAAKAAFVAESAKAVQRNLAATLERKQKRRKSELQTFVEMWIAFTVIGRTKDRAAWLAKFKVWNWNLQTSKKTWRQRPRRYLNCRGM